MAIDCRTFIEGLIAQGIYLFEKAGRLGCKTAQGVTLSAEQKQQIQAIKPELIAFLAASTAQAAQPTLRTPPPITATPLKDAPLSFAQQQLWAVQSMNQQSTEYHMNFVFDIQGDFDVQAAKQSFLWVFQRHEVLRSVYVQENGEVIQRVQPLPTEFSLPVYTFSADVWSEEVNARLNTEKHRTFDLTSDLMLRACLLQKTPGSQQSKGAVDEQNPEFTPLQPSSKLVLTLHHIAADGWSIDVLFREFIQCYKQCVTQQLLNQAPSQAQVNLAPLAIQYRDFARWQREWFAGDVLNDALAYWDKQLQGVPECHRLPTKAPRPAIKQSKANHVAATMSADVAQGLQQHCRDLELTPFMLLHGALVLTIAAYSDQKDIVIGIPSANRTDTALNDVIGYFVNTLVLRANTEHADLAAYFQHIKQQHLDAQMHQMLPFERLVERAKVTRSTAYNPLFQIMLITNTDYGLSENRGALSIPGATIQPAAHGVEEQVKFDIDIRIDLSASGVQLAWSYDVALFSEPQIQAMNAHLQQVLQQLAETKMFSNTALASTLPCTPTLQALLQYPQPSVENAAASSSSAADVLTQLQQLAQTQGEVIALKTEIQSLTFANLAEQVLAYIQQIQSHTKPTQAGAQEITQESLISSAAVCLLERQIQTLAAICVNAEVNERLEPSAQSQPINIQETQARIQHYWPATHGVWGFLLSSGEASDITLAESRLISANLLRGWTVHLVAQQPNESLDSVDVMHGSVTVLTSVARRVLSTSATNSELPAMCCEYQPQQNAAALTLLTKYSSKAKCSLLYATDSNGEWFASRTLASSEFRLEAPWCGALVSDVDSQVRPKLSRGLLMVKRAEPSTKSSNQLPNSPTGITALQVSDSGFVMESPSYYQQQMRIAEALYSIPAVLCVMFKNNANDATWQPCVLLLAQSELESVQAQMRQAFEKYDITECVESVSVAVTQNVLRAAHDLDASDQHLHWSFGEQKSAQQLALETELSSLWGSLLPNANALTVDSNLFEVGATSMLMILAISKMNATLNVNVTPDFIVQHVSVAAQARALAKQQLNDASTDSQLTPVELSSMVPFVENAAFNTRPAVYWIHPYGGSAISYRSLAKQLPMNSYGLQAPFYSGIDTEFSQLHVLVESYAQQIAEHATQKNILLAGFSLGGVIAAMLVPVLQQKGFTVHGVWALDSYLDSFALLQRETLTARLTDVVQFVNADSQLVEQAVEATAKNGQQADEQSVIAALAQRLTHHTQADIAFIRRYLAFHAQLGQLDDFASAQQMTNINVPICLIANKNKANREQNQRSWQALNREQFASHFIEVQHSDFLKEAYIQPIAEFITQNSHSLFEEA